MKLVQFLKNRSPYNVGETAGFPDVEADRLARVGIVALVRDTPPVVKNVPARTVVAQSVTTDDADDLGTPGDLEDEADTGRLGRRGRRKG